VNLYHNRGVAYIICQDNKQPEQLAAELGVPVEGAMDYLRDRSKQERCNGEHVCPLTV
jgi:hypothetical protein